MNRVLHGAGVGIVTLILGTPLALATWFVMLEPVVDEVRSSLDAPHRKGRSPDEPPRNARQKAQQKTQQGTHLGSWLSRQNAQRKPPSKASPPTAMVPPAPLPTWTCGPSVTLNYDWHDDVLCTDGVNSRRPYLLPDDSFVSYDELRRAAGEYAAELNRGR